MLGFTLENYAAVLDPVYLQIVIRSIALRRRSPPRCCLAMGYPVAYFIGRAGPRWRNLLLMLVMVPFWTSFLIRTYAWVTILKSEGLLNSLLIQLQLISQPLEMLYTPGAVVLGPRLHLPAVHDPADLLERREARQRAGRGRARSRRRPAARLLARDRAADRRRASPRACCWSSCPSLGIYAVNDILGGGRVDMIGNIIENQFKGNARNWPFGAALGTTLLVTFALIYWFVNQRQRVAAGR